MNMANDIAAFVELLRSRIVSDGGIREFPSLEMIYLKLNVKVFIGFYILAWGRAGDNGRNHVAKGGDVAHRYWLSESLHRLENWSYGLDCTIHLYFVCRS